MKSIFPLLTFFSLHSLVSFSQTYTYTTSTESNPYIFDFRNGATLVYAAPKDDELSSWQSLPFARNFYGKNVTGYYISDNGYITFDTTESASNPNHEALPSPMKPNNAIYAFWEDFHLESGNSVWSNEVRTVTKGTAPNRAHVIMWISVVPKGVRWSSSNTVSFAIVLYEGGDFDVIIIAGRHQNPLAGTIGCENAEGSFATMVNDTTEVDFPVVTADPNDDVNYKFRYSSNAIDLGVIENDLPKMLRVRESVQLKSLVKNFGIDTIRSFGLHYQVGSSPTQSQVVSGITLTSNQSLPVAHVNSWTPDTAGIFYPVKIWIDNVNGFSNADTVSSNDTLRSVVFTHLDVSAKKRVLVEEFTGAWCGWCPDGAVVMNEIERNHPSAVLVSIHAGGIDSMVTQAGTTFDAAFRPGYPQAMIDRVLFQGYGAVPINRGGNAWQIKTSERERIPAPLSISIDPQYDASQRRATVNVRMDFVDYPYPGDFRLNVFVIEDRVTGIGKGYDQTNYYSKNPNYPNHPYYNEPDMITGFVHRHVLRKLLTSTWGDGNVIPDNPAAGSSIPKAYSFFLSETWKEKDIKLVAFVSYYNESVSQREVLNASDAYLFPPSSINRERAESISSLRISPLPARSTVSMEFVLQERGATTASLFNILGQEFSLQDFGELEKGEHSASFDVSALRTGCYLLRLRSGSRHLTKMIVVQR